MEINKLWHTQFILTTQDYWVYHILAMQLLSYSETLEL